MERISQYISYKEATFSQTAVRMGIDNTPTARQLFAMKNVGTKVFDPIRIWAGVPIGISSFFRCPELNIAIGDQKLLNIVLGRQ